MKAVKCMSKDENEREKRSVLEVVGRGGALVETMTFNQRVVGSPPALAAT